LISDPCALPETEKGRGLRTLYSFRCRVGALFEFYETYTVMSQKSGEPWRVVNHNLYQEDVPEVLATLRSRGEKTAVFKQDRIHKLDADFECAQCPETLANWAIA